MYKDFIYYQGLMAANKDNGLIYIFSNPTYPDAVKIGKTTRLPGRRAAELSKSISDPTPLV